MPKGTNDGSVFKRREERAVLKGGRLVPKLVDVWYARVRYTDAEGREREKKRRAEPNTYARACELRREIQDDIDRERREPLPRDAQKTFAELAARFKVDYLIPPRYIAGKKVAGLRSHKKLEPVYETLVAHFGPKLLADISYTDLREFKRLRLATPVSIRRRDRRTDRVWHETRQRSVAAVDRELQLLRRMLNVAAHLGWAGANPFRAGDPLIVTAHENKRMRVLDHDEEPLLLAACGEREKTYARGGRFKGKTITVRDRGETRAHLRPAIICALDTALRSNEQFTLTRGDVQLDERVMRVREHNAKIERERLVPITDRLRDELVKLFAQTPGDPGALVFPHADVSASFKSACRAAGLEGLRWHDLRHTAIMWMLEAGLPESEVMKITGHTNWTTFMRYVNLNSRRTRRAAEMLDERRLRVEEEARAKAEREAVH